MELEKSEEVKEVEERASPGKGLSCLARKRASLGMASLPEIRYTQPLPLYASALEAVRYTVRGGNGKPPHSRKWGLQFFGGDHSRDACQVVGDAHIRPCRRTEQRAHRLERVIAQLENQDAARHQKPLRLADQRRIDLEALLATKQRFARLVPADFAGQRFSFVAADVGRVADDETKEP